MARLIAILDTQRVKAQSIVSGIAAAQNFYVSSAGISIESASITALDGTCHMTVLTRPHESGCLYHDMSRGVIVAMDGTPQEADRFINAKEIAYLYRTEGPARMADAFDGGWSAIIVDEWGKKVLFFRDRMGLKPIYYYPFQGGAVIASNVGALIRTGWISHAVDEASVARYAVSSYRAVYGREQSFFKDIRLLPSATFMEVDGQTTRSTQYWDFKPEQDYLNCSDRDMEALYREQLIKMINAYLKPRRQGKIAVALSGGVDSGSIVGLIHHSLGHRVDAISMTYNEESDFDETRLIKCSVRDHAATWHNVKLDSSILLNDLSSMYKRFDVPLATVSIYGYDYLYREAARRGMQTIFTGAGGDYLQGGNYTNFLYALATWKVRDALRYERELEAWIRLHGTSRYPKSRATADAFFAACLDLSTPGQLKSCPLLLVDDLLQTSFVSQVDDLSTAVVSSYKDYHRSYMVQEYRYEAVAPGTEAEDMIDWSYGTSMTSPFFSKQIVELGWSIPLDQKIRDGVNKILARRALRGICANEILDCTSKSGFNAPFDLWIRGPLKTFVLDVLSSHQFCSRGIYNMTRMKSVIDDHMSGRVNHMMVIWQALNLELWMQAWVD